MPTSLGHADRVGPYQILEALGQGAMGAVYSARDDRLSRNVAIKVITQSEHEPARLKRFMQEARSASALNHPNIVTIHDFGSSDGISYIVSELIQGESLRSVLKRGPLPIRKLLDYAVQIADALQAAHEAGIVHRDLKPENIMITPGGRVKLLDFGLAKPLFSEPGEASEDELTQPGLIVGTVAYLSPEQARGGGASLQSDQFALGLILHEMATGHHPLKRETPMETLLAIAGMERPPFTPGPVGLRMLVERCLSPVPENRFENTSEIAERLRKVARDFSGTPVPETVEAPRRPNISPRIVSAVLAVIAVVVLAAVAATRLFQPALADPMSFRFAPFADTLIATDASWSPNGRLVAFAAESDGVMQIFTRALTPGSQPTQVTSGGDDCVAPFWSPDGLRIYYVSGSTLWSIYSAGGTPDRVDTNVERAAVSRDGRLFAKLRADGLYLGSRRLDLQPPIEHLEFSPNGNTLAVSGGGQFRIVNVNSGVARAAFKTVDRIHGFSWLPDSRRVLLSNGHLLVGDIQSESAPRQITNGHGSEWSPAVAPDGSRVLFSAVEGHSGIQVFELPRAKQSTLGAEGLWPAWAPSGSEYAYVARGDGKQELRLRSMTTGWERTIAQGPEFRELAFSPSGLSIAYTAGNRIFIAPVNGETPTRVSTEESIQAAPAWSPDGNSIAYFANSGGKERLVVSRVGAGEQPRVIREGGGSAIAWSPDGKTLAVGGAEPGVVFVGLDGRLVKQAGEDEWVALSWGTRLVGVKREGRQHAMAVLDPVTGAEQSLASLERAREVKGLSLTRSGTAAAVAVTEFRSRLWELRGFNAR